MIAENAGMDGSVVVNRIYREKDKSFGYNADTGEYGDLRKAGVTGAEAEARALAAGLSVNKNAVPDDPLPPMVTSGLRLGTAAATTRGMGLPQIAQLADVILGLVRGEDPERHRKTVAALCAEFPMP
jgi:glycine hydroxymethyltransferase